MRVAVATWSIRAVGGVEEYLSILLPALVSAGIEVALWHELDRPTDRAQFDVPPQVTLFSASELGADESVNRLRAWRPDVLYVQGLTDGDTEAALLTIAPAVFFVHSYADGRIDMRGRRALGFRIHKVSRKVDRRTPERPSKVTRPPFGS